MRNVLVPSAVVALIAAVVLTTSDGTAAPAPGSRTCWSQPTPTWTSEPTPAPSYNPTTTTPSTGTGTPAPRTPTNPTGPTGPTGPTRPKGAGTDWHEWWGADRIHWWQARDHSAVETRGGPESGSSEGGNWIAQCEALAEKGQWNDRAAIGEAMAFLKEPLLTGLALRLMNDPADQVARQGVFATAAAMPTPAAGLVQLRGVIENPRLDEHRRSAALLALGSLGDPSARELLLRFAAQRRDRTLAIGGLVGLGLLGDVASIPMLHKVLLNSREKTVVQTAAAASLGVLARTEKGAKPATEAMLAAARIADRLNGEVRQTLVLNLGHGEPNARVVRQLAFICEDSGDMRTRAMAAIALGRVARRDADTSERVRAALTARWKKEPPSIKAFLALGLGIGKITREKSRLEHWLHSRGDPLHRASAAVALGLMGDPGAHQAIAKAATEGGPPQFRGDACEGLGLLGTAEAAETLRALCDDQSQNAAVHAGSAYGLGLMGQTADRERLVRMLDDRNADARAGVVMGCGAFAGVGMRDALLKHAKTESMPNLRGLAAYAAILAIAERPLTGPAKSVQRSPWAREH